MTKIPHVTIRPKVTLNLLSQSEIAGLSSPEEEVFQLYRNCALAILNTDTEQDDASKILAEHSDFEIDIVPQSRGVKLEIRNAPEAAFVDGEMVTGIRKHLFSALRDIVFTEFKTNDEHRFNLDDSAGITDAVFRILRNANTVKPDVQPNLAVCWGGHSIPREEYDYSKEVGYQLGLRGVDIVTGCGIGAMKGPMKGAAVGHAKQHIDNGRYIGISEPGIIASESPNAIVNELIIMPDIEKRLEAFVRLAHCIIVFPGGVGTVEEVLYLLSILTHPDNHQSLPLFFTGPSSRAEYFKELDHFLRTTLGNEVAQFYQIITGDSAEVARQVKASIDQVHTQRSEKQEAYYFNWSLNIAEELQMPFIPTHDNMAALKLDFESPIHHRAAQLRAAFSGLVAGNVKAFGIEQIAQHGPYEIRGDEKILAAIDTLLHSFIRQKRMKIGMNEDNYTPCYKLAQP
jgi:pyrimidine/purine-5'-nucleotide nucleosidase